MSSDRQVLALVRRNDMLEKKIRREQVTEKRIALLERQFNVLKDIQLLINKMRHAEVSNTRK